LTGRIKIPILAWYSNLMLGPSDKGGGAVARSINRKMRHERLSQLIRQNPLLSDEELASTLDVSVSTVRLDRTLLGVPELRERTRRMAEQATSKLRSLKQEEFIGDLLELEPNRWALSVLKTRQEMAFRHTEYVWDHYIYAQASSLAIAVVGADMVIVGSIRGRFKAPAKVGDVLMARAKVGVHKGNKYIVSVRTRVGEKEIFVGRYIVVALDSEGERKVRGERLDTGA
jgi:hypothetical protein